MIRFDAYTATAATDFDHVDEYGFLAVVADALPGQISDKRPSKGFHGFGERMAFLGLDGHELAAVQWGGRNGAVVMLEVKGECTPAVVDLLRQRHRHRCTRVDACADFDAPRAFERLYRACRAVKRAHRIIGGKAGDWEDFPERGRTQYLGASSSATRLRLYEKGLQREYAHLNRPNWCRLETQVRPVGPKNRYSFSGLKPSEVWGSSRWTRDLAMMVLLDHVDPHPAGSTYRLSDRDQALEWMCRQYGGHLLSLAGDLGDWECVGRTIGDLVAQSARKK